MLYVCPNATNLVRVLGVIDDHQGERIRPSLHRLGIRSENHAKLRHWGLIEGGDGRYRITELGWDFLAGEIRAPAVVTVRDDMVVGEGDELVGVRDL